ncbi:MAG: hypothetical protein JWN40_4751 [Phycisphaerales bacterium]|jgi:hypothetical protein|nr:hypothetical protein [Phycisphaerales bacterium]
MDGPRLKDRGPVRARGAFDSHCDQLLDRASQRKQRP